jgi:hypothetical protein
MEFRLKSNENRQLSINMDLINTYTSRWLPNTWFDISITRKQKTKSTPMRKYFFGVVMPGFLKAYWYDPEEKLEVHKYLKCKFFNVEPDKHGIYRAKDIPSVFSDDSELPISEKQAYVEWVKRKASQSPDNPVYIPDPGEE